MSSDISLDVQRYFIKVRNNIVLKFALKNKSNVPEKIGYIGIPMIFNNMLLGKKFETAHTKKVFYNQYNDMDAGYLQVTRLKGKAPTFLSLPEAHTTFEA